MFPMFPENCPAACQITVGAGLSARLPQAHMTGWFPDSKQCWSEERYLPNTIRSRRSSRDTP